LGSAKVTLLSLRFLLGLPLARVTPFWWEGGEPSPSPIRAGYFDYSACTTGVSFEGISSDYFFG